ncbi:MAG: ion transporter [Albidovulum sp.]|nr:ion transporter [Albidovulum sp.]
MKLADIVHRGDTVPGRVFDWIVIGFIVISIISFSIDTLPELPHDYRAIIGFVEIFIVVLFTLEYCLRVATAPSKRRYIFSFFGIVDLLAIIPFYLSLGFVDLSTLRIVRVIRILRILKLARYNSAMLRFGKAVSLAKEEIVLFGCLTVIILYLSAVGIYYFEHAAQPEAFPSIVHSLWWATATLTTVGYGDVYPITAGGKLFTFVILMCGLGIVAVPSGLLAAALTRVRQDEENSESDGT